MPINIAELQKLVEDGTNGVDIATILRDQSQGIQPVCRALIVYGFPATIDKDAKNILLVGRERYGSIRDAERAAKDTTELEQVVWKRKKRLKNRFRRKPTKVRLPTVRNAISRSPTTNNIVSIAVRAIFRLVKTPCKRFMSSTSNSGKKNWAANDNTSTCGNRISLHAQNSFHRENTAACVRWNFCKLYGPMEQYCAIGFSFVQLQDHSTH